MLSKIKNFIPITVYFTGITLINFTLLEKSKKYGKIDYNRILLIN